MDLSYKQRTLKIAVYLLLTAGAALIQNTAGLTLEIGGARCFLLLPVCMILGAGEDERFAAVTALIGGMLWDLSSAVHLGFNAIYCFLYWLFFIIIKDVRGAELSLFTFYLPSALYTILATPVIYFSLKPIKRALNKPIKTLN